MTALRKNTVSRSGTNDGPILVPDHAKEENCKVGPSGLALRTTAEKKQQTLGKTTYNIDPSKLTVDATPVWKTVLQRSAVLVALPVAIPAVVVYTLSMWLGPHWWRNKVISTMVGGVMKTVGAKFDRDRAELLQNIQPDDLILDLGAGPGYYLKYLLPKCRVVALEPCENFHETYRKMADEAGLKVSNVEIHACDIETYRRKHLDRASSFDWVICGNVLCEVDDQLSTLETVNYLLKPGGHVYFSEHIGAPQGSWTRFFQDCFNPWWRTAGAGCNCNRDSLANIRSQMPSWQVISWQYNQFKVAMGPFVLGLARKRA